MSTSTNRRQSSSRRRSLSHRRSEPATSTRRDIETINEEERIVQIQRDHEFAARLQQEEQEAYQRSQTTSNISTLQPIKRSFSEVDYHWRLQRDEEIKIEGSNDGRRSQEQDNVSEIGSEPIMIVEKDSDEEDSSESEVSLMRPKVENNDRVLLLGTFKSPAVKCTSAWSSLPKDTQLELIYTKTHESAVERAELRVGDTLVGYLSESDRTLVHLLKESLVECILRKQKGFDVQITVYLLRQGTLPQYIHEKGEKYDFQQFIKVIGAQTRRVFAFQELFELLKMKPVGRAFVKKLMNRRMGNYSPEEIAKLVFKENFYDPFVRATVDEVEKEEKEISLGIKKADEEPVCSDSEDENNVIITEDEEGEEKDNSEEEGMRIEESEDEKETPRSSNKKKVRRKSKSGHRHNHRHKHKHKSKSTRKEKLESRRSARFAKSEEETRQRSKSENKALEKKTYEDRDQIIFKKRELNELKFKDVPEEMATRLREYQRFALSWMLSREGKFPELWEVLKPRNNKSGKNPLFEEWKLKNGGKLYLNIHDGRITDTKPVIPEYFGGGILADDMGLGKTVMSIALILANSWRKDEDFLSRDPATGLKKVELKVEDAAPSSDSRFLMDSPMSTAVETPLKLSKTLNNSLNNESNIKKEPLLRTGFGGTLIVCPPILREQWKLEVRKHTKEKALKVLVYDTMSKNLVGKYDILEYDIIITSYKILGEEIRRKKSLMTEVFWHRVILDEAHNIRTRGNLASRAVFKLKAKYRWTLTGTPIQNKFDDIFSLLHFLDIDPWGLDHTAWESFVNKTLKTKDLRLLQHILKPIMLRRTKVSLSIVDKKEIDLPPKTIQFKEVKLSKDEREYYENYNKNVSKQFLTLLQKQALYGEGYFHIFKQLIRMRQICDHPVLVKANTESISRETLFKNLTKFLKDKGIEIDIEGAASDLPAVQKGVSVRALRGKIDAMQQNQLDTCTICLSEPETNIAFSRCGHTFCEECIAEYMNTRNTCPNCHEHLEKDDIVLFYKAALNTDKQQLTKDYKPSAKVSAVMESLIEIANKKEKCVCFTQWMGMMDILEIELNAAKIQFVRLDGKCSKEKKKKVLAKFLENPDTTVLMVSLMLGGVGLNLTQANHVLLVEPWWNPGVEAQAIERVHRIGQTRPVFITKFVCKDTIEERMIELQEHKKEVLNMTLASKPKEASENFKYLLNLRNNNATENSK